MPMVSLSEVLRNTREQQFAVGAFDTMDHAFTEGILQAAEESRTPIIVAAGDFPGPDYSNFLPYLVDRIARTTVPVCLHFDHGASYEACARAIRAGFSSVMIDGSNLPFETNIAETRRVVEMAHACGVTVEGEIGHVGASDSSIESAKDDSRYTEPEAASEFVEKTGVDALAVAIGTAHGVYKSAPKMDFNRLSEIRSQVSVPLVMHGASGLSEENFKQAIQNGMSKINAFTNLTLKVSEQIDAEMSELSKGMSHEISLHMTKYAKEEVLRHIRLFGTKAVE
ncbi:class II fructose-bisphosphate aldolase [Chloroflexota bacterium]|nr:class II fructose-bisphosphate aldolase [Chloroflexota bacterium]